MDAYSRSDQIPQTRGWDSVNFFASMLFKNYIYI